MIPSWLIDDLQDLFERDSRTRVILWHDPKREFHDLIDMLRPHFKESHIHLLGLDPEKGHGALWLKWAVEVGEAAQGKVVLWLPLERDALLEKVANGIRLGPLVEYRYTGVTWLVEGRPPTMFAFLKKHGVPLSESRAEQDALWRGGPASPLAKYVKANLLKSEAFWTSHILSSVLIEESIVGDVQERLFRFLADPNHEWLSIEESGIAAEFCSQITAQYTDAETLAQDPYGWAQSFVRGLIALDIFTETELQDDFPFKSDLPDRSRWRHLTKFLNQWRRDRDHLETYIRWAEELEPKMDCAAWVRGKSGRPSALKSLARDRWLAFLQELKKAGTSETKLKELLSNNKSLVASEASGFWAEVTNELNGWSLVQELSSLLDQIEGACQALSGALSSSELVDAYAREWYRIDLRHWQLLAASRRDPELELVATAADRFYLQYLEEIGRGFYESYRSQETWPPDGCAGATQFQKIISESTSKRIAILVVDALRYDLAAALFEQFDACEITPLIAAIPSVTWVGMNSLLPAQEFHLEVEDSAVTLRSNQDDWDLGQRAQRWKIFKEAGFSHLGVGEGGSRQDELHHLHNIIDKPNKLPNKLVLFERGVDSLGHSAKNEALRHFEQILEDLTLSIRKLKLWGYQEIHVITDHGFILLNNDKGLQTYEVDQDKFEKLSARWGILKEGQTIEGACFPFVHDPSWEIALSPGLRSFKNPGRFFHGGGTLQEVVIPHLKLVSERAPRQMRVNIHIPKPEIATLAVRIELEPEFPPQRDLFDTEIELLHIQLYLGEYDQPISKPKEIEVTPGEESSIGVTLFLQRDPPTPKGAEIPIQVLNMDTGENFAAGMIVRAIKDLG